MDSFSKHWASHPRLFPGPCPLLDLGYIVGKAERVERAFQSCNFSFILRGGGDFKRKGITWRVEAPCVITQWPGELLDYGPRAPGATWDELYLIFEPGSMAEFRRRGFVRAERPVWPIRNIEPVMAQVESLLRLCKDEADDFAADRVDRVCERLILESLLTGTKAVPRGDHGPIQEIVDLFHRKPNEAHDLDRLARKQGLSASTLRRRWFAAMRTTPGRYLLDLRLRNARQMLAETTLPIGEVAARNGFEDMFYFSRRFKKETKLSPSQYRQRHRY